MYAPEIKDLDITVHEFKQEVNASPEKLDKIREESEKDTELQCMTNCPPQIVQYWNYRDEVSVVDGLMLKGNRIIIPKTLQPEVLEQIHFAR